MNPRVKSVKPFCDYQLLLEFTNDEVGIYDCKYLLDFGVFKELQDINYFKQVSIVGDTVAWINDQDIHRCLFKRFPYSVIYGIDVENIVIIAIAHQHRKPDYWQNRLN